MYTLKKSTSYIDYPCTHNINQNGHYFAALCCDDAAADIIVSALNYTAEQLLKTL